MTTHTFSIGFPDSSTMYPSRRQSPGSGVGLERGAGSGLTCTEAEIPTNVAGRGAGVPTGVDLTRAGVADGSTVGDGDALGVAAFGAEATAKIPPRTRTTATAAAPIRTRGSRARSWTSKAST